MSRRMFQRNLLYYLTATAILVCGSSQRTSRRAFCPSCSRDCPEALASPWYPRRSDVQAEVLEDYAVTSFQNSPYFRLPQRGISQNIALDDVLSNRNPISPGRYRSFSQQGAANGYPPASRLPSKQFDKTEQQNSFHENFPKEIAEFLSKQTIPSLGKPANSNSFARASPSRQFFGKPKNAFFTSSRDERSMSENLERYNTEDKKDLARKFNVVYRADQKPSWEDSRSVSSDEIVPRKSFPMFRQTGILDEEKNAIERSPHSMSQQYNFAFPQDKYFQSKNKYSVGFDVPKAHREPHVFSQNLDVQKSTESDEIFGSFMEDSLETSNPKQLKWTRNNFFKTYPMEEEIEEMVTAENDEQIHYPYYNSPRDSHISRPTKDETTFPNNWNFATDNNLHDFIGINQHKEAENNWPQVRSTMEKDVRYFNDEKDKDRKYFEDEFEEDTAQTETSVYNPYALFLNKDILKATQDRELSNKLDFMLPRRDLQGVQKRRQAKIYPVEENGNKYFQDEKNKYEIQDETPLIGNDRVIRTPVINVTPYIFPQSLLNILNASKYLTPIDCSITKDLTQTKNNILHANPTEKINDELFKDGRIVLDDERNQDRIFVKDTNSAKEYNSLDSDRRPDTKNNTQNEALTELDPDFIDEVENPLAEPTEPTPIESFEKRSTST